MHLSVGHGGPQKGQALMASSWLTPCPKCGSCLWGTECLWAEPLCPRGQGQGLHCHPKGACCPYGYPASPRAPVSHSPRVPVTSKRAHHSPRVPLAPPKDVCDLQRCWLSPKVPVAPGSTRSPPKGLELGDTSASPSCPLELLPPGGLNLTILAFFY